MHHSNAVPSPFILRHSRAFKFSCISKMVKNNCSTLCAWLHGNCPTSKCLWYHFSRHIFTV